VKKVLAAGRPRRTRHGICGLCGFDGKLSKTHIPPRAAGNVGSAQTSVAIYDTETRASVLSLGRKSDGGTWGWWLCEQCNNRTELWEREYLRWVRPLFAEIQRVQPRYGQGIECSMPSADPGAVARLLWGWMFALDPRMRIFYPDVASAILTGDPVEPPPNRRMLLAATPDLRIWMVRRRHDVPLGLTPLPAAVPLVAIASPPFVVVLADPSYELGNDYLDTSAWLRERAGERRAWQVRMPVVASFDEEEALEDQPLNQ
jgi:hypothetical protein